MPRWFLFAALLSAAALALIHGYAVEHFLYWRYRWFDMPMHILGGVTLGLFLVSLLTSWRPYAYLAAAAAIAIGWEVFEYAFGISVLPGTNYAWDTAHDILNDAIGFILVYVIARYTVWRSA